MREELPKPRFEVFKDSSGAWRWRFQASNNKIIADSSEGYINKQDCMHGLELVKKEARDAEILHK